MDKSTSKMFSGTELPEALALIRLRLGNHEIPRIIVAAPTLKELRQQALPAHLKTSVQKRTGPRISERGPRNFRLSRLTLAHWPQDRLVEKSLPSLACVVRGQADLRVADYILHCQTGDFVFYPAGTPAADSSQPHFTGDIAGRRCDLLWIFPGRIYGEGLECAICHSVEHTHTTGAHNWVKSRLIAQLFQGLQEELQQSDHHDSTFHLLTTIVILLSREITLERGIVPPYRAHPEYSAQMGHDPIDQARIYIESHLGSHLTIESVARESCLSPSVFTRRFKKQTGQTFNQYVTALRMKRAGAMLRGTELKVAEVSQLVGLKECQLRNLSRRYWNCSPKEFRTGSN